MSYERRGGKGGAAAAALTGDINLSTPTIPATDLTTWAGATSNGAGTATINRDQSDEEVILFTGVTSNTLTGVTRGQAGTSAQAHGANATLELTSSFRDFDEANAHIADTTLDHHTQYLLTTGARVIVNTDTAQVLIRATAPTGQAGDLIELEVNGDVRFRVDASGNLTVGSASSGGALRLNNAAPNNATSATAGSNGALPAQVRGYWKVNIDGTPVLIPYFNV